METYYAFALGEYTSESELPGSTDGFPNPEKAKERKGLNTFIDYKVNDKVDFQFSGGLQDSYTQSVFNEPTFGILSNRSQESKYVDLRTRIHGLNVQVSQNGGSNDVMVGQEGQVSKFDFNIFTSNAEYGFNFGKLVLRPGINYQEAKYTDVAYAGKEGQGYFNAERTLSNLGYRVTHLILKALIFSIFVNYN